MSIKYLALLGSLGFLGGAALSIIKREVLFKTGYRLRREADPFGFWGAVVSLAAIGVLGIVFALWY